MAEGASAWFDFTEGEGQHKRQFATGGVDCVDLLLLRPRLRPTWPRAMRSMRSTAAVALAKATVGALGLARVARRLRR